MNDHIEHFGAWGSALTVIVVASWFPYRSLVPKTWKEWASAGVNDVRESGPTTTPFDRVVNRKWMWTHE